MSQGFPIVGIDRLSLSDYPGKLCANIVSPGCNFRCPYCLKEHLILDFLPMKRITEEQAIALLHPRIGFLDGVCMKGGEPTIHRELPDFLTRLKSIGSLVKVDTNGSHPNRLGHIIGKRLVDYVAMEVKVPLDRYRETVQYNITPDIILDSVQLIRRSRVDYEFRTTVVPEIVDGDDLEEISKVLAGSKRYVLQGFKPGSTLSRDCLGVVPYSASEMRQFRDRVAPYFGEVKLRI